MRNPKELHIDRIDQIGVVVKDLDQQVKHLEKIFGGSFEVLEGEPTRLFENGRVEKIKAKVAFLRLANIQIELLQIIEGPAIHSEWLKERGEGIHHVGIFVDNFEEKLKEFKDKGYKVLHEGKGRMRYAYLDTKPFVLELIEKYF
jgi:methylmalonyl-CoA/ethylmalonyl-CoA epimerase